MTDEHVIEKHPDGTPRRRRKSRRQRGLARSVVVAAKESDARAYHRLRLHVLADAEELAANNAQRPKTRAECIGGMRPCPWLLCREHLYLDISPGGGVKLHFPDLEPWQLAETCALDIADRGGVTLEQLGELTNVTRERARQLEIKGLMAVRAKALEQGIGADALAAFAHPRGELAAAAPGDASAAAESAPVVAIDEAEAA